MILTVGCAASFALGLYAVLTRRELLALIAGAEVMIGAANVQLVALAVTRGGDPAEASAFALLVIAATAAESAVGLALIVTAWRRSRRGRVEEFEEVTG